MSVVSKGVVVTSSKDVLFVLEVAQRAVNQTILVGQKDSQPQSRDAWSQLALGEFHRAKSEIDPATGKVSLRFIYKGFTRVLTLDFFRDEENLTLGARSISVSMTPSAESAMFVTTVVHALSMFGPGYVESGFPGVASLTPVPGQPLTVLDAAALGYISPSSLPRWHDLAISSSRSRAAREDFLGTDEDAFLEATESIAATCDFIDGHAASSVESLHRYRATNRQVCQ